MDELLDAVIFGDYTAKDMLIFAVGVAVFLMLFLIVKRVFFKKKEISQHFQLVECTGCGWHGKVSSFAGRCPKCNQPLGDRKAQRR